MFKIMLLAGVAVLSVSSVMAQECSPGPRCRKASQEGESYLSNYGSRYKGPAVNASSAKAYCLNKVGEAVAQSCAAEMASMGKPQCASLARQQQAEHLRVANQAKAAAAASAAISNWRSTCGF